MVVPEELQERQQVGDWVLGYDEATGTTGYYTVTATSANMHPVLVFVTIEGESIKTTPEVLDSVK